MKITAFIGVIGSGKDHNAKIYIEKGYHRMGFSDGIREYAYKLLGWAPENEKEYEIFKLNKIFLGFLNKKTFTPLRISGREILENIGTLFREEVDPEYWGNLWLKKAHKIYDEKQHNLIVLSDCRHDEEAFKVMKFCLDTGSECQFIFTNYKSQHYEIRDHSSEKFAQYFLQLGCEDQQDITKLVYEKVTNWINKNDSNYRH